MALIRERDPALHQALLFDHTSQALLSRAIMVYEEALAEFNNTEADADAPPTLAGFLQAHTG